MTASRRSRSRARKHCALPALNVANCSFSSSRVSAWSISSGWAFRWISTRSWAPPTGTRTRNGSELRDRSVFDHRALKVQHSRQSLRTNVKSSMTHHSLEQYVVPATMSSVRQPARKTGKQASDCSMLFWSMHALSCGARQGACIS
eukprot:scaffold37678_cov65-Phaeocystis_antarctica.AAC.3